MTSERRGTAAECDVMVPFRPPLLWLVLLLSLVAVCTAQSGDGSDDEDQLATQSTYACENGQLVLQCPPRHVIRILRANYGRFSLTLCNPLGITTRMDLPCQSITSMSIVAEKCDGHERCEFQVTNDVFGGDPCRGTSKYAEVKHYCEPADSGKGSNSGTSARPHLPDAPYVPRRPTVPIPEQIQVCLHPAADGSVYDIYWQLPDTTQNILHFMLLSSAGGEINEELMPNNKISQTRYAYIFTPQRNQRSFEHMFAIKAFSVDYGWGDYSEYHAAERCRSDGSGQYVTPSPPPTLSTTTTTSTQPKDGGGLRQMCHAVDKLGIRWPETWPNEVIARECPSYMGQGVIRYKCLSTGVWDPNGPKIDDCKDTKPPTTTKRPPTTTPTTTTTTSTTTSKAPDVAVPVPIRINPRISSLLKNLTLLKGHRASTFDLPSLLPSLSRNMTAAVDSVKDPKQKAALAHFYKDSMLTIGDELLRDGAAWTNLSVHQQRLTAAALLDSIETTGLLAASTMAVGQSNTTRRANVVMKLVNLDLAGGQPAVLDSKSLSGSVSKVNQFTIPNSVLHQVNKDKQASVAVVFVVLSNMSEWLTPEASSGGAATDNVIDSRPRREPVRRLVNSDIVSASLSRQPVKGLVQPVTFLLQHRQVESVANPKCSFWDSEASGWSTTGCRMEWTNKSHTACSCDHLTSFAVLMDITGASLLIPSEARFSLELITYIGCVVSIVCLMLSWVTFACFKSLDCDRNTIHKHLVFCLMVAQIVLIIGIQQTQPRVLCGITAGVMHFFFLASFAWMCLEGVQLYVMLVEVFEAERSRIRWYYLFGYGTPTIVVAVSAGVYPEGYGTETHCWLTIEQGFIWSFVGPAIAVMLVNVVMLGMAIYIMVRHSAMSHTMRQKTVPQKMSVSGSMYSMEAPEHTYHRPEIPMVYQDLAGARYSMGGSSGGGGYGYGGSAGGSSHLYASVDHLELLTCRKPTHHQKQTWVKGAVVLVVLLGLTWVFGVLYLDNEHFTLVFAYVFTLLNSLQGLFIFLFHCLINEKVQKEYRRLVRHTGWLPDCLRVRYGGASSSGSREPTSSGNVMARFLRGKKKHAGSGDSSSNSARPFLHKDQRHISSSVPSSSDGATSSRLSTDTSNNNHRKSSRSSTLRGSDPRSPRPLEVNGVVGELSAVLDCSVVDTEFVSEYCQQNLRVSNEVRRYSTASEDSDPEVREAELEQEVEAGLDRLAALSVGSLSQQGAGGGSDFGDGDDDHSEGWADSDNVDGDDVDEGVALTRGHYVNEEKSDEEDEGLVDGCHRPHPPNSQPLGLRQTDSERVLIHNAANKPRGVASSHNPAPRHAPSLSEVGPPTQGGEKSPAPGSVPCLRFQPAPLLPQLSPTEERDAINSLPDLNRSPGGQQEPAGNPPAVKRHSSDGHVYFSPFRFSSTDC